MTPLRARHGSVLLASTMLVVGSAAAAQDSSSPLGAGGSADPVSTAATQDGRADRAPRTQRRRASVEPYVEVGQIVSAELGGSGDVLTYTTVAAGVDASIATARTQGAASVRYEHRFGWGDRASDGDILTGALRGQYRMTRNLSLEAGAIATRSSIDGGFGTPDLGFADGGVSRVYSVYAGPTYAGRVGDLDVGAAYRIGYSASDYDLPAATLGRTVPRFEDAVTHYAVASLGMRPGPRPFGWTVSAGYEREKAGQLDQRYESVYARGDITVPVSPTLALVGGVGVERIEVSYRPPLLDPATGTPVVDAGGGLVVDPSAPRRIAFDTSGLIWDAGVMWRPSRRMSLEARIGRRYDDWSYSGSWSFQPNSRTSYQLGVYDRIGTVGRGLTGALAALPTDFAGVIRNPIDGSLTGCLFGAQDAQCLNPLLGNLAGLAYRNRGVVLTASQQRRLWTFGVGFGYDNRSYLDESAGLLSTLAGDDETWFASLSASRPIDERTAFSSSLTWQYYDAGISDADAFSAGANVALARNFWRNLSGQAALGLNIIDAQGFNTRYYLSALLGVRYNFQ